MKKRETHLIAHLEELRQRIIKTLLTFILFLITGFLFVQDIYDWLIRDLDEKLAVLGPGDILWVYMMIAGCWRSQPPYRWPLFRHGGLWRLR
ncbi:hypothetical protein RSC3_00175 [Bacillus paralicheniformis]|nr:hypothetical protein RSC3_00175 [Bacillus paralicheniformis]